MRDNDLAVLPKDNTEYSTKKYWDERYEKGSHDVVFDWFKTYSDIKDLINTYIKKDAKILMLGCGNSSLSEDMYNDGYSEIVNIDFSEVVIDQMKERCSQTTMKWEVMDVLDLKYNSNEFDAIIDKGTMDALMCEKGDVWDPSPQLISVVTREIDGVERKRFLTRDAFELEVLTLGTSFHYFAYICKKKKESGSLDSLE
ncbi:Methyltransferase-like protein 13 [Smittium culicis]|uniref:Methyltransferase-like protein 13 n=1 Tax=Smittium culicis TaxID=133412 RepID=A0A1R1YTC5_9FUNG|nr:Methyltransferase-like protein 13 [Smittium culicis]